MVDDGCRREEEEKEEKEGGKMEIYSPGLGACAGLG